MATVFPFIFFFLFPFPDVVFQMLVPSRKREIILYLSFPFFLSFFNGLSSIGMILTCILLPSSLRFSPLNNRRDYLLLHMYASRITEPSFLTIK